MRLILIQPPARSVYPAIKEPADVAANQANVAPYTFYLKGLVEIGPSAQTEDETQNC